MATASIVSAVVIVNVIGGHPCSYPILSVFLFMARLPNPNPKQATLCPQKLTYILHRPLVYHLAMLRMTVEHDC